MDFLFDDRNGLTHGRVIEIPKPRIMPVMGGLICLKPSCG